MQADSGIETFEMTRGIETFEVTLTPAPRSMQTSTVPVAADTVRDSRKQVELRQLENVQKRILRGCMV